MYAMKLNGRCLLALGAMVMLVTSAAQGAVLDVCGTCTYTDINSAVAAASSGDIISISDTTHTLTGELVITAAVSPLRIQGVTSMRPDQSIIEGASGQPGITVEEGAELTLRGVSITGGTVGVQVLGMASTGGTLRLERTYFTNTVNEGLSVTGGTSNVEVISSIFNACGAEGIVVNTGSVNITQSTFIDNGGEGINGLAGTTIASACFFYNNNGGGAAVQVDAAIANAVELDWYGLPGGGTLGAMVVTEPGEDLGGTYALEFSDPENQVFDSSAAFRGAVVAGFSTGTAASLLESTAGAPTDYLNAARDQADIELGAHEFGVAAGANVWTESYIYQRNRLTQYVGEGEIRVELVTDGVPLTGAVVFIENVGSGVDVLTEFLGPFPIDVSGADPNFGEVASIPIFEADFVAAFPSATTADIQGDHRLYIDTNGGAAPNGPTLHGSPTAGANGGTNELSPGFQGSRIFALDTIPPIVATNTSRLADQYLAPYPSFTPFPADGVAPVPGGSWLPEAYTTILGDVGANGGYVNGVVEPNVFLNSTQTTLPGSSLTVHLTFLDPGGSGFETDDLPTAQAYTGLGNGTGLYFEFQDQPGMAWWNANGESEAELLNPNVNLNITYTNVGGTQLDAQWSFSGLTHDLVNQWHAVANIRVMDLAGNEATLDESYQSYVPLQPLHLWWFPGVLARIKSGPSGAETAEPRFTWGLERLGGGGDPRDPEPCLPGVRWNVWKADTPGIPGTSWTDLTGTWSEWLDPVSDGVITLNTFFSGGTTLRDLMAASPPAGIQPGDEFLLAVVGYDEAGNSQPQFSGNLASAAVLTGQGINYNRWVVPDADMSLGLDTRVQPLLWHNATDAGNILLVDGDERVFGAASRIPLPPEGCTRVEGQFTVEVGLPSDLSGAVGAVVGYEILEDGVLVMQGRRDGVGAVETFVFPEDILAGVDAMTPNPTAFLNTPFDGNTPRDCDGDGTDDKDRLGDEGRVDVEPPYRRRDVEYQIRFSAGLDLGGGDYVFDSTPATVEFTVIAGSGASKATDQAIKQFKRE